MIGKIKCLLGYHSFRRQVIFLGGGEFVTEIKCIRCGKKELEDTRWKATTKSQSLEDLSA